MSPKTPETSHQLLELPDGMRGVDVYLLDQVFKGRLVPGQTLLDAGCGGGRHALFFQQHGWQVSACDHEPQMLSFVQDNARQLGIEFPADRLRCEPVQRLSFDNAQFDAVICCAVLHFLPDLDAFHDALTGLVRVTKPGGIIIIRTVTATGIEKLIDYQEPGWYDLPDGSERLVLDHSFLLESFRQCGLALIEPLKSVVVHQARSMGTLVVQRTN